MYESESCTEESDVEEKAGTESTGRQKLQEVKQLVPSLKETNKLKVQASKQKAQSSLMSFFKKK